MPEAMSLLGDNQDCLNLALTQDTVSHMPGSSQSTHLCGLSLAVISPWPSMGVTEADLPLQHPQTHGLELQPQEANVGRPPASASSLTQALVPSPYFPTPAPS